ncbi:MAG: DUF4876 domain-containing protein, partial [Bacteroidales bacterium]|nr:DUF4876 domain-containing protein [Bacteroidales bacterium]
DYSKKIGVIEIEEGVYNITAKGDGVETDTTNKTTTSRDVKLSGLLENMPINGEIKSITIKPTISIESKGFVFKELYFSGSKTPAGRMYLKDKYFEIYNNTSKVLYADGLVIAESVHTTTLSKNPFAKIIDSAFVVHTLYSIPGDGNDYPVQPGKGIILCDVAINHKASNSNSIDLSKADFEWYDKHRIDVDVPSVPNLVKNFSYSPTIWTPHNRGVKAYAIFKPKGSMKDYMTKNIIDYTTPSGRVRKRYKIPNDLIIDAVELSTPSRFKKKALSASLDFSYTHCGDGDDARFGKCVRRKVKEVIDGRTILMDTNDSRKDFESTVDPKPKSLN